MISARFRHKTEPIMSRIARYFMHIPPNLITILSIFLAILAAYAFALQMWFAGMVVAIFAAFFDALDGAVARAAKKTTKFGAYLDALVDRYVEGILLFGIGLGTGLWVWVTLALLGALLIPYAKARASMEIEIDNINWPDLMERGERLILITVLFPICAYYGYSEACLIAMVILFHYTALQRIYRAYTRMKVVR